jgi:hypothetical protein
MFYYFVNFYVFYALAIFMLAVHLTHSKISLHHMNNIVKGFNEFVIIFPIFFHMKRAYHTK